MSTCLLLSGCALDVPAAEPSFDDGRPALTLYQVQDLEAEGHPEVGTNVRAKNLVVTCVDRFDEDGSGKTGTIFVQEIGGGAFSGIQMFRPAISPAGEYLLPGDVVEAEGLYAEFELGQINPAWSDDTGRTLTQLTDGIVRKTGEWISPEPSLVNRPEDLQTDPVDERWEGVLVELNDVGAITAPDSRGAFSVGEDGSTCNRNVPPTCAQVDDDNYAIPSVAVGSHFDRLVGIITYIYTYKILPRSALDVEIAPPAQD